MSKAERTSLADKLFSEQHPELNGRALTKTDSKALKAEWGKIYASTAGTWSPNSAAPG